MEEKKQMEDHILAVAKELFLKHGFDKVSTTQIAKEAGCNQALVHYYYRTKTKLFERIMQEEIETVFSALTSLPEDTYSLQEKVEKIIDVHFSFLGNNPEMPMFLLGERRNNPEIFTIFQFEIKRKISIVLEDLQKDIDTEVALGRMRKITAFDLMLDILSLDIFAALSKPFADIWDMDKEQVNELMNERKAHIKQLVLSYIQTNRL